MNLFILLGSKLDVLGHVQALTLAGEIIEVFKKLVSNKSCVSTILQLYPCDDFYGKSKMTLSIY